MKALKYFIGTHDFSALRSSSCSAKSWSELLLVQVYKVWQNYDTIWVWAFSTETGKINGRMFKVCWWK